MLHIFPCVSNPVIFLSDHFSWPGSTRGLQRCCFPLISLFPCNEAPPQSDRCTRHLPAPPGGEGTSPSKTYGHLQGCGSAGVWTGRWNGPSLACCSCETFGAAVNRDWSDASDSLDEEAECVSSLITGWRRCRGGVSPLLTHLFSPCRNSDMKIPNGLLMFL